MFLFCQIKEVKRSLHLFCDSPSSTSSIIIFILLKKFLFISFQTQLSRQHFRHEGMLLPIPMRCMRRCKGGKNIVLVVLPVLLSHAAHHLLQRLVLRLHDFGGGGSPTLVGRERRFPSPRSRLLLRSLRVASWSFRCTLYASCLSSTPTAVARKKTRGTAMGFLHTGWRQGGRRPQ